MRGWPLAVIAMVLATEPTIADPGGPAVVQVAADRAWTATPIAVKRGDEIAVAAAGVVHNGKFKNITPDGMKKYTHGAAALPSASHPSRSAAVMTLLARIGDGPVFTIGMTSTFTAGHDGPLQLGVNDLQLADNSGAFTVTIRHRSVAAASGASTGGATYGVRQVQAPPFGGATYGAALPPNPLDNTRWRECAAPRRTVMFFRGGALAVSGRSCGDARWTYTAGKLAYACGASTTYELTGSTTMLRGTWHGTANPSERGVACLRRAGTVVITQPSEQQLHDYAKAVTAAAINQCTTRVAWTGRVALKFYTDGDIVASALTPDAIAECVGRVARNTRAPSFAGPPFSTAIEFALTPKSARAPTVTRPATDARSTLDVKPTIGGRPRSGCPAGNHEWAGSCYRCPPGSSWLGGGKCRNNTCPAGTHRFAGGCYSCPAGTLWAGGGKCRR